MAPSAPPNIADLVKDTETLASEQADAGRGATALQLRAAKIVVVTEPTELIVTDGAPKYSPLVGGEILYVTNTDSDIFMEVATQRHFIPKLFTIDSSSTYSPGLDGVRRALGAARHLLEIHRRDLTDKKSQRHLQRLENRLVAVAFELDHFGTA